MRIKKPPQIQSLENTKIQTAYF